MNALAQLELKTRNLCGPKYGSKREQIAYGKAREHWHKAVVKGATDRTDKKTIVLYQSIIDSCDADPTHRESLSAIGQHRQGAISWDSLVQSSNEEDPN